MRIADDDKETREDYFGHNGETFVKTKTDGWIICTYLNKTGTWVSCFEFSISVDSTDSSPYNPITRMISEATLVEI